MPSPSMSENNSKSSSEHDLIFQRMQTLRKKQLDPITLKDAIDEVSARIPAADAGKENVYFGQ